MGKMIVVVMLIMSPMDGIVQNATADEIRAPEDETKTVAKTCRIGTTI